MTNSDQASPAHLRLRAPHHRVEKRAVAYWTLRKLIAGAFWLALVIVPTTIWDTTGPWLTPVAIVVGAIVALNVIVQPWWRYSVHRWECTELAVYGLSGWLVREWRVAPLSRVQTIDAVRGPLEQLLGLSTLRVTTASAQGAISIVGLDKDVAAEWADRLTVITEQTEGDAT